MKFLVFILSIALATGATAQTKKKQPVKPVEKAQPAPQEATGIEPGIAGAPNTPPPPPAIYQYVEQMPASTVDIADYITKNLRYPDSAQKAGIQGRVVLRFVVNEDGTISDISVARGIGYGCDEEAIRLFKSMPPMKPGKQGGKPVKVMFTQPVTFRLE